MNNNKTFWWAVFCVWAVLLATDWVFHGIWMNPWYMQTAQFWRPQEEMQKLMWSMWLGQWIFSWAFVWIYTKGVTNSNPWHQAFRYGFAILAVSKIPQLAGWWATTPYPWDLMWRWLVIDAIQAWACAWTVTWALRKNMPWAARA